jgi:hypothetical protein
MLITYRLTYHDVLEGYKSYRQGNSLLAKIAYHGLSWGLRLILLALGLFLMLFDETTRSLGAVLVLIGALSFPFQIAAGRMFAAQCFQKNPSLKRVQG